MTYHIIDIRHEQAAKEVSGFTRQLGRHVVYGAHQHPISSKPAHTHSQAL